MDFLKVGALAVLASVTVVLLAGCGGSYTVEYDCSQRVGCCERVGRPVCQSQITCEAALDAYWSAASSNLVQANDTLFRDCGHLGGCDFAVCMGIDI